MSQAVVARNTTNVATIENWVESDNVKKKFQEVLDKGAGAFVTSLLSLVKSTPQLAAADPKTILSAAMTAATLKLPISPNLGFAYIIPYGKEAQFQMGYKGYIQLAMRTGQYKTINAAVVYEGQIEDIDFVTGEIIRGKKKSDKVVGYVAYFELINGFSKSFSRSSSVWKTNFDAMGLKTVIKQLISKYGIMSIDMQSDLATAISSDVDYDRAETQNVTPLEQAAAEQTIDAEADVVDAPVEGEPEPPAEAEPAADVYDGMDF